MGSKKSGNNHHFEMSKYGKLRNLEIITTLRCRKMIKVEEIRKQSSFLKESKIRGYNNHFEKSKYEKLKHLVIFTTLRCPNMERNGI